MTSLILAAVAGAPVFAWRSTRHAAFEGRDWIVVANLDGNVADSALRHALRDALMLALQQSRYVNVEPPSAIAQAIRMTGKPDTTRLTETVAREVALRQGARAVLLPGVTRVDSTYLFTARVIAPRSGADIVTVRERAGGDARLLDALDRLAVDVRKQLGERLSSADPVMALERATTQSLDALRAWTLGNRHFTDGRFEVAQAEYERALALDSTFAMAHKALGATLYWMNQRDEGDRHLQRAVALADRLTDRERLLIRAEIAKWRKEPDAAAALYQQFLLQYPDDLSARYGLGFVALGASWWNEAIEQYEWLRAHDSTDAGVRINLATCYAQLHRYPEALAEYRIAFALRPQWSRSSNDIVAEYGQAMIWAGRPASAESLYHVQLDGDAAARASAHRSLALLSIYRGRSATARELLRQAIAEDTGSSSATSLLRDRMYLVRALFDVGKLDSARQMLQAVVEVSRKQPLDPPWLGTLGELAVRLGNRVAAKELETRVVAGVQSGSRDATVTLHSLRGEIALLDGNTAAARDHFEAALAARREPPELTGAARSAIARNRGKEAEELFAEVVAQGVSMTEALPAFFEAHLELGRLAAARGDTIAARQHLGWIMAQWAGSDSDLVVRRATVKALASLDASRERLR